MWRRLLWSLACCGIVVGFAASASAANDPRLEQALQPLIQAHRGQVAIAVRQLDGGTAEFLHQAERPMPTASLIKLPVMIEAYRQAHAGQVDLSTLLELKDEDKVPGSGILTSHFSAGTRLSLRDAIRLMIAYSDNTATNLVLGQIGLPATAQTMEQFGLPHTKIHAKVFRRDTSIFPERSQQFGLGSTTAGEMLVLLERLHRQELVSPEASEAMRQHLLACDDKLKLARSLPARIKFAHKTGAVTDVRTDAGILYLPSGAVAVCVLTSENADHSWGDTNAAELLCSRIGQILVERFAADDVGDGATTLREGASGELVEDLQRTLNARLEPSPELSVDGEFGPATASAVRQFQAKRDLAVTGSVDQKTWDALGPLVTEDPPVPAPADANALQLPRDPPEDLLAPPLVTAKAWVVYDAAGEKILAEHRGFEPLEMASTTKTMTAFLALRTAEAEAGLLDEPVTMSERADKTGGSTSGLRAGERVSLRELLYGLMLPSGNDAAVAIAEHLGRRLLGRETAAADVDPLARFVEEMNRAAQELGMTHTHFENPHGLPAAKHRASPRDLALLARAAMQLPEFRGYVATRQHGCEVLSVDGHRRNVLWKNTNRLLSIEGYDGVKTGTTTAAGACLVSSVRHGDQWLVCVVLGASTSDARYLDSRNLLRWALARPQ